MHLINLTILILFMISGCSSLASAKDIKNYNSISGSAIKDNYFDVISNYDGYETWKNSEGYKLYIQNGKILRTYGLKNDFILQSYKTIKFDYLIENKSYKTDAKILFSNPSTNLLDIFFEYKLVDQHSTFENDIGSSSYVIEESFNVPIIKWSGKNYFLISNNQVIKSTQIITPFSKKLDIKHKKNSG